MISRRNSNDRRPSATLPTRAEGTWIAGLCRSASAARSIIMPTNFRILPKRAAIAIAMGAISFFASARAHADPERATLDWGRVLVEADQLARNGTDKMFPAPTTRSEHPTDTYTQNATNTWFGVAPRMSFIARDWGATHRLFGDRLSVVDTQRLTRSARMVMWRVRLNDARLTPFAQLGLGQWRVDTLLLPLTPHSEELAGQVGGGFELRVGAWQIACENTVTAIYREQREANNIPQTRMWSTMLASKIEF
jgi:hypothetical protein